MTVWQADFYRRPLQDELGNSVWELVVCDPDQVFTAYAFCPQSSANSTWLREQLQQFAGRSENLPKTVQVFRPQSVSLLEAACQPLGIAVEPTRRTLALKDLLQQRADYYRTLPTYTHQLYEPVALEQPPPLPLPESMWGEQWRFAAIASSDLVSAFSHRPIPVMEMPDFLLPINLQLPSTLPIPGVIIYGGRQSMRLVRWLQQAKPISLSYISGDPDGLILSAGLVDRWVIATVTDEDVVIAAKTFRERQQASKGLHFLLIQPDDSGMTYSGIWLLRPVD